MSYLGDFAPGAIIDTKFCTVGTNGTPVALADSPAVSVYKDNGTTEKLESSALTVSFDSRTGLNHVRIDTSGDATFYSAGSNFQIVITAGTVGGTSVVGYRIAEFSINSRSALRPSTAGRTIVVDSNGRVDVAAIAGTAQTARDIGASVLLSSGTGAGQLDFTSGVVKSNLTQTLGTVLTESSSGRLTGGIKKFFDVASPTGTVNSLPDSVPGAANGLFIAGTNAATTITTALTTTFTGNVTGSVASVANLPVGGTNGVPLIIRGGTAQSATSSSITLDTGASTANDLYTGGTITIRSGTGAGQTRSITAYVGSSSKIASVAPNWAVTPSSDSVFEITANGLVAATDYATSDDVTSIISEVDSTASDIEDAVSVVAANAATAIGSTQVEGTLTWNQALQVMVAALGGKASGLAGTTVTFRDTTDSTDRIVATVDSNGNRSSITLNVS